MRALANHEFRRTVSKGSGDREILLHVHKGTGPSGSLSFVSEKVPCLTQCVGSWTARSRLRTDMIMTIITMTVYIIDKNKGTKTAIVTDLPEATRNSAQPQLGGAWRDQRLCL